MNKVNIILAIASNFVIGNNNSLPWYYKEDLQHFRNITSNTKKTNYLICGYKTYESMKHLKLKNRKLIVINKYTNNIRYSNGNIHVKDFKQAIQICNQKDCDKIFVIGGKKTFEDCIKESSLGYFTLGTFYLTRIKKAYKGDVKMDPKYLSDFHLTNIRKTKNMDFCEYSLRY